MPERITRLAIASGSREKHLLQQPMTTERSVPVTIGINAIGYFRGSHGLGVTARQTARLIRDRDIPLALLPLDAKLSREERDPDLETFMVDCIEALPYNVNLFIGPLGDLPWLLLKYRKFFEKASCLNVALSMWELAVMPMQWKRALECFDVLLAPSNFMRYVFATNVPDTFIVSMAHSIDVSPLASRCSSRFALPPDKVLFISSFDPWSDTVRKNPFGAIAAFKRGMGADDSAHLVIKLNNVQRGALSHPDVQKLSAICNSDPRLHLITDSLSYAEVLSLYASCDVFVSLHRAEGLGLGLMEAMALGKPVIATAWSGNMSFMNHVNSCLVGYDLVPLNGGMECYRKEFFDGPAVWADPHIDEAAGWIRRLSRDANLRVEIGQRAAHDIASHNSDARKALFVDEILSVANRPYSTVDVSKRRSDIINAIRDSAYDQQHTLIERFGRDVRQLLDRHLLWRFRAAS